MKYNTLIIDLDNTLVDFDAMEIYAVENAFEKHGIDYDDVMISDYHHFNDRLWVLLEQDLIEKEVLVVKRFRDLFEKYDIQASPEEVNSDYMEFMASSAQFIDGARELLDFVKGRYTNVMMTNGFKPAQDAKIKKLGLKDYFDYIIISDEVGVSKPSIGIYEYMETLLGTVDKSKVLAIGDSISSDITGGKAYGVDTLWYNRLGVESKGLSTYEASSLFEVVDMLKEL